MKRRKSLSEFKTTDLDSIRLVLTDIDDTITLDGKLPAIAYSALERLQENGFVVIPVTGRPAGWCDHIARMWPVNAIVGENGAFSFRYDHAARKMHRVYTQPAEERRANQMKLNAIATTVLRNFPGTAIASDQAYREIDVAIDFCEDVPALSLSTAKLIAREFELEGAVAKVSSIHVNAWFGKHDKLSTSLSLLAQAFDCDSENAKQQVIYLGDSPNDEPMFKYFPNAVGVANVQPFLANMQFPPVYLTQGKGGIGFAEVVEILVRSKFTRR